MPAPLALAAYWVGTPNSFKEIMPGFRIIQGGMGVGVSGWPLARAVARRGQLGVVSGTGLAVVLTRRLEAGDPDGHVRRGLAAFPIPAMAQRVLDRYYVPGGKAPTESFSLSAMPQIHPSKAWLELTVLANFVEVYLAKEGHDGVVGVNYLEKLQIPTLPSLFGAMLAGVDYVLMGAGIPRFIPGALDALAAGQPAELKVDVEDAAADEHFACRFDPTDFLGAPAPLLKRPKFLAVISSATLAMTLARKSNGHVDGFVIEGATAGGHNAPPRGQTSLNDRGEPIYGLRDDVDMDKVRALGLPFWMAGGYADPGRLADALAMGAEGIQVGTAFGFCAESSITPELKRRAIELSRDGKTDVYTDRRASPTGFPFKVARIAGTLSDAPVYKNRVRICDVGYLRRAYRRPDGTVGYRCPAEPVANYVAKGGLAEDTEGRTCLCNSLFATIGLSQVQTGGLVELALVTAGDDAARLSRFVEDGQDSYTADEVIDYLLATEAGAVQSNPAANQANP